MDIVMCYLFVAAVDSFLAGRFLLSAVECAFFFWSKPFIPPQMIFIAVILFLGIAVLRKLGFQWDLSWISKNNLKKLLMAFSIFSIVIAGPFLAKSTYYTGTPLYPFGVELIHPPSELAADKARWGSLKEKAREALAMKDGYGYGRSPLALMKFLLFFAIPTRGVNNEFDYPAGLTFLLFLGPFLYLACQNFKQKQIRILPLFIMIYWLSWWMGSHQTRFLYIPIVLMILCVLSFPQFRSTTLMAMIIIALSLTMLSVYRANKGVFGKTAYDVLRPQDRELVEMGKTIGKTDRPVVIHDYTPAFADFLVDVKGVNTFFVLN